MTGLLVFRIIIDLRVFLILWVVKLDQELLCDWAACVDEYYKMAHETEIYE